MISPTQMQLTAAPDILAFPGVVAYTEVFNTDSSLNLWGMRRDVRLGRTRGQMFMTTDGILIFRCAWGACTRAHTAAPAVPGGRPSVLARGTASAEAARASAQPGAAAACMP